MEIWSTETTITPNNDTFLTIADKLISLSSFFN